MPAPDAQSTNTVVQALTFAGGGSLFVLLGAFLRGLLSGTTGQEKELREGLAGRVGTLEARVAHLETALERVTSLYHDMRWQRDTARLRVNALEVKHGEAVSTWAADPPINGGTP